MLQLAAPAAGPTALLCGALSARELYERERSSRRIITFCPELDGILGGGVAAGQITEFCGPPGIGKTQVRGWRAGPPCWWWCGGWRRGRSPGPAGPRGSARPR